MVECLTLFGTTFAHEDVAIVAAGFFIVEHGLRPALALGSVYGGMVASDWAIYGLGRVARSNPALRRWAVGGRVAEAKSWVDRNLVGLIAMCRVVPGLLFPSFVACGWFGVPFRRFAALTMLVAAVYAPLMLLIVMKIGESAVRHLGVWAWGLLVVIALSMSLRSALRRRRAAGSGGSSPAPARPRRHRGMPSLRELGRTVAIAERVPPLLFYVPFVLDWLLLAVRHHSLTLPSAANPHVEVGGFWGESKSRFMSQIGGEQSRWTARFVTLRRSKAPGTAAEDLSRALEDLADAEIPFPLVVKPDVGWQGYGVRRVADEEELRAYVAEYPAGELMILQRLVPWDGEAGVLYARRPGEEHGWIPSLTLRYFPTVAGDGRSTVEELIRNDPRAGFRAGVYLEGRRYHRPLAPELLASVPAKGEIVRLAFVGSIRVGGLYRDFTAQVTPALTARFDAIARSMPDFHFGRFDVRFRSLESLLEGEDFSIIEINGAGAELIHVWDPELSLLSVYRTLFRGLALLFEIGAANRARGFRASGVQAFLHYLRLQRRLVVRYPRST